MNRHLHRGWSREFHGHPGPFPEFDREAHSNGFGAELSFARISGIDGFSHLGIEISLSWESGVRSQEIKPKAFLRTLRSTLRTQKESL